MLLILLILAVLIIFGGFAIHWLWIFLVLLIIIAAVRGI